jgi:hypothetical protein
MRKQDMIRLRITWYAMKNRCLNPNSTSWRNYGGRGIAVCKEWIDSFEKFCSYMGVRPSGTTIDRINNDGNYEPGNVRWASPIQQANNKRHCGRYTSDAEPATERMVFCVTPERQSAWKRAAGERPVYVWMKEILDAAANYKPKET